MSQRIARSLVTAAAAAALLCLAVAPATAQGTKAAPKAQGSAPAAAAPSAPPAAAAVPYAQRFASLCAACHGANGKSEMPNTPALAGQHSFYAITQLFLFREGRRPNEAMTAIAKTMKDDDLRGFSDYIATLPAVAPSASAAPATPPDAARMAKGKALATEHRCVICHGADLAGGQQVPRIAHQREDYLQMALREFKTGKRAGYTRAMAEAVNRITPEELDTIAYYVARFPAEATGTAGTPGTPGGK